MDNNTLLYTDIRRDDQGNQLYNKITDEQKKIINNIVILDELPYEIDRVVVIPPDGDDTEMVEIDLKQVITNPNQYKVNYDSPNADVYFHPDRNGQTMHFKYTGMGLVYIDGSRVVTKYENGTIIETLDGLIEQFQANGDYAKEQGDYAKDQGDNALVQATYAKTEGNYAKDQGDFAKKLMDDFLINYDNNINITHNLNTHPYVLVYGMDLGYGNTGYGEFGYGGTDWEIKSKTDYTDLNNIKIYLSQEFDGTPVITKISNNLYNVIFPDSSTLQVRLI